MHPNLMSETGNTSGYSDANAPLTPVQKLVLIAPWAALAAVGVLMIA